MIITRSCKKNVCAFLKKKAPQLKKTSLHQAWSLGAMSFLGSHSAIRANRKAREVQVPALIPETEQFFFTLRSFTLGSTNFSETPAISFSRVLPHTCGWNIFLSNTSPQLYANTATQHCHLTSSTSLTNRCCNHNTSARSNVKTAVHHHTPTPTSD